VNLCNQSHPRLIPLPSAVVMNHGVWTKHELSCLHAHEGVPG